MVAEAVAETIEGVVARVNDHGFILEGSTEWLNLSRYAKPAPLLPHKGMKVTVGLDKDGYVRSVTQVRPTVGLAPEGRASELLYRNETQPHTAPPDTDTRIARMNVLGHAVAIASSGGQTGHLESVLGLAARLEAWVNR